MHLLAVSLLSILAGTLLLAKTKKEELGKFFAYISWFFIVVGFLVFVGFIAGGICKMSHCCKPGQPECRREMMMKDFHPGMQDGKCCAPGMMSKGSCEKNEGCMKHDSAMKCCAGHPKADTAKMCCPKPRSEVKTK
jgi:hypothetical protein